MCRPQDIASAPAVGGTYIGSDIQPLLRKFLGNRLTFVVRKNIIIITPAPEKEPEVQQSVVSYQPSVVPVPVPDTLYITREHEDIEMLRAYSTLDLVPLDSLYDRGKLKVKGEQYNLIIGEHTTLLTGVYGDFSGTCLTPWAVGVHLAFLIGK